MTRANAVSRADWSRLVIPAALLWLGLALLGAGTESATFDEFPHLAGGLAILEHGDYRMNPEHPPLVKILGTLPLWLFYRPNMSNEVDDKITLAPWLDSLQWEFGYYMLFLAPPGPGAAGDDPAVRLFLIRIVPILIGLLGAYVVYMLGSAWGRCRLAGLLAMPLLLFYPEYLGHARYLTYDVAATVACGAMAWAGLGWWRQPGSSLAVARFVGLAMVGCVTKLPVIVFTVLLLFALGLASILRLDARRAGRVAMLTAFTAIGCWIAAWGIAGFRFAHVAPGMEVQGAGMFMPPFEGPQGPIHTFCNLLWEYRILPEAIISVIAPITSFDGRLVYLFDELSRTGWYHYFAVTTLFKTPVPLLLCFLMVPIAAVAAAWRAIRRPTRSTKLRFERALIVWVPYLSLLALVVVSRANIGHRHVLFMYLPLAAWLGAQGAVLLRRHRPSIWRWAIPAVAAYQVVACLAAHPNHATYANELVLGSQYRLAHILRDSNVDWGQSVRQLSSWLEKSGYPGVNYAVFGHNRPESWGIEQFNWLLPNYPFALYMPPARLPNLDWPTAVSLHCIDSIPRGPGSLFGRDPDVILGSIIVFLPERDRPR